MTGDAEFIVKELPDVLYVPSKLVKTENSKKYVLKQNKEKVFVTIGEEMDGEVEIKDGLKENDIIY
jgi:hypothetical protein